MCAMDRENYDYVESHFPQECEHCKSAIAPGNEVWVYLPRECQVRVQEEFVFCSEECFIAFFRKDAKKLSSGEFGYASHFRPKAITYEFV